MVLEIIVSHNFFYVCFVLLVTCSILIDFRTQLFEQFISFFLFLISCGQLFCYFISVFDKIRHHALSFRTPILHFVYFVYYSLPFFKVVVVFGSCNFIFSFHYFGCLCLRMQLRFCKSQFNLQLNFLRHQLFYLSFCKLHFLNRLGIFWNQLIIWIRVQKLHGIIFVFQKDGGVQIYLLELKYVALAGYAHKFTVYFEPEFTTGSVQTCIKDISGVALVYFLNIFAMNAYKSINKIYPK